MTASSLHANDVAPAPFDFGQGRLCWLSRGRLALGAASTPAGDGESLN